MLEKSIPARGPNARELPGVGENALYIFFLKLLKSLIPLVLPLTHGSETGAALAAGVPCQFSVPASEGTAELYLLFLAAMAVAAASSAACAFSADLL